MESQNEETITNMPLVADETVISDEAEEHHDVVVNGKQEKEEEEEEKQVIHLHSVTTTSVPESKEEEKEEEEEEVVAEKSPVVEEVVAAAPAAVAVEQVPKTMDQTRFGFKDKVSTAMKNCISQRFHLSDEQLANFHGDRFIVTYLAGFGKKTRSIANAYEVHKDAYTDKDAAKYKTKSTAATIAPDLLFAYQHILLLPCLVDTTDDNPIEWDRMPPKQKEHTFATALGKRVKYIDGVGKPAEAVVDAVINQQNFVDDLKKKSKKKEKIEKFEKKDEMNKQPINKQKAPIYHSSGSGSGSNSNSNNSNDKQHQPQQPQGKSVSRPPLPQPPTSKPPGAPNGNKISWMDEQQPAPTAAPAQAPRSNKSNAPPAPSSGKAHNGGGSNSSKNRMAAAPLMFEATDEAYSLSDVYKIVSSLVEKMDELQNVVLEVKASVDSIKSTVASNNNSVSPPKSRQGAASRAQSSDNKAGYNKDDTDVAFEVASLSDVTDAVAADLETYREELMKNPVTINNQRDRDKKKSDLPFIKVLAKFGNEEFDKWKYVLHFVSLVSQEDLFGKKLDAKFTSNNTARLAYNLLDVKDTKQKIKKTNPLRRLLTYRDDGSLFISKANYDALLKQIKFIYISFLQRELGPVTEPRKGKTNGNASKSNKSANNNQDQYDDGDDDADLQEEEGEDGDGDGGYYDQEAGEDNMQQEDGEEQEQDGDDVDDDGDGPGEYNFKHVSNKKTIARKGVIDHGDDDDDHVRGKPTPQVSKKQGVRSSAPKEVREEEEGDGEGNTGVAGRPEAYVKGLGRVLETSNAGASSKKRPIDEPPQQATAKPAGTKSLKLTTAAAAPAPAPAPLQPLSEFDDNDFDLDDNDDDNNGDDGESKEEDN